VMFGGNSDVAGRARDVVFDPASGRVLEAPWPEAETPSKTSFVQPEIYSKLSDDGCESSVSLRVFLRTTAQFSVRGRSIPVFAEYLCALDNICHECSTSSNVYLIFRVVMSILL
jgi:hypothetical protein